MAQDWPDIIGDLKHQAPFREALAFVKKRRAQGARVYPSQANLFAAFRETPWNRLRVVILGQDPYHGPGQAHGLCFSVLPGVPQPPSLKNIFKELESDLGLQPPAHGCLLPWARQGVLLLNAVLSVEEGKPQSHANIGWEAFTDAVIHRIAQHKKHVVFLLWGASAQKKLASVDLSRHTVLKAPHPSPLSAHRGFFGCRHFSRANEALQEHGQKPIDWSVPNDIHQNGCSAATPATAEVESGG
jgi:uracil-DNA glycosylase